MAESPHPVVVLIQARMGSSRLPGKVMRNVAGRSLLAHLLQRLRAAKTLDNIVLATTCDQRDDELVAHAAALQLPVFRGDEADVLDRFVQAARAFSAQTVVRITADCPLMDPAEVDRVVGAFLQAWPTLDYASNQLPQQRKVPLGLAVEVFSRVALEQAGTQATHPHQREHVTPYLYDTPGRFRTELIDFPEDLSEFRITVDTPQDLAVVTPVLEALAGHPRAFALQSAIEFLRAHPEITSQNADIHQKAHTEAAAPRPVLLLRADATVAGGTGHVMRVLGLGQAWRRQGGNVLVVSKDLPEPLAQRVVQAGLELVRLLGEPASDQDADQTLSLAKARHVQAVLVDGYHFNHQYLASLRLPDLPLAYVDDFAQPDLPVDLALMPNAGAVAPEGHLAQKVLAGSEFTPVRDDLRLAPRPPRQFDHSPLRLLLTFGGSDPAHMSLRILPIIQRIAQTLPLQTTLLLGPAQADIAAVRALAAPSSEIEILHNVKDMPGLLARIDLACSAAGTTTWELATLGVPTLLVPVADNQAVVVRGLLQAGAGQATAPAWELSDSQLESALVDFLHAGQLAWQNWSQAAMRLIDGGGADRIITEIKRFSSEFRHGNRA